MNCPQCGRQIPADAQFCIYCRARVAPQPVDQDVRPATGPTVRLGREAMPSSPRPVPVTPPAQTYIPGPQRARGYGRGRNRGTGMGIFPFGMLILFFTGWWWPGILLLLGITALADGLGRGRPRSGIPTLLFFLVLTMLFSGHDLGNALWFFSPFLLVLCMMLPMSIWWWFDRH